MGLDSSDPTGKPVLKDLETTKSDLGGILGKVESLMRRFRTAVHALFLLPLYGMASVCLGISLLPGLLFYKSIESLLSNKSIFIYYPLITIGFAASYFVYGFALILVVPMVNFLMRMNLKPWRGPYHSISTIRWYIHNALTYLVRYTFLEFITPTPFNILFFRLMGMKIGKDVQLNSAHISDPSLITIGDKVTIGGSATIVAHYGVGGLLVLSPVVIHERATIGLKATIMGGVTIGANARILPNSVVLPKTIIPEGETWGGVPAQKIDLKKAA